MRHEIAVHYSRLDRNSEYVIPSLFEISRQVRDQRAERQQREIEKRARIETNEARGGAGRIRAGRRNAFMLKSEFLMR